MIVGAVINDGRTAVIDLVVRGRARERSISAVVDTGFTGALTLPFRTVKDLALIRRSSERATLADGSEAILAVYLATVIWDGAPRRAHVLATPGTTLVGMALLHNHELTMQVKDGGAVRITALSAV